MGCYLAPGDASKIEYVVTAISQRLQGAALLVVGDFNTNFSEPEGRARDEDIAAAMATAGLEYLSGNFLPRHKPCLKDGRTWCMRRGGREVRYWTDYILGTDHFYAS